MNIWPFKPRGEFTETLSWRTDVFRAKAAEQRIALRVAPRRTFNYAHTLTDYQYAGARALIREYQGDTDLLVPDWGQAVYIGPLGAASAQPITADLSEYEFGETALLWQSVDLYEQVNLVDDSNETSIAPVINDYTSAYLIPLWQSVCPGGLNAERIGANLNQCSVAFQITENEDLGASDYDQYRSHDVLDSCPKIGGLRDTIAWPVTPFDNLQSALHTLRRRNIPDHTFTMKWHNFNNSDTWALRRWLHSRRGRQKVFWFSSFAKDFEPAASASGTTLTTYALPGSSVVGQQTFDLEVVHTDGTKYRRRVDSVAAGTPIAGRSTLDMTLDSSLTITLANIERISFLRMARFDVDGIQLLHRASGGVEVQAACREVEQP